MKSPTLSENEEIAAARTLEPQGQASSVEQVNMLARLHRDGIFTDEEPAERKRRLLDGI